LERKKTPWNIPRERLRSAHNIGPGLLAPQDDAGEAKVLETRARRMKGS